MVRALPSCSRWSGTKSMILKKTCHMVSHFNTVKPFSIKVLYDPIHLPSQTERCTEDKLSLLISEKLNNDGCNPIIRIRINQITDSPVLCTYPPLEWKKVKHCKVGAATGHSTKRHPHLSQFESEHALPKVFSLQEHFVM